MSPVDFPRIPPKEIIAVDTETTGLKLRVDRAFGFSVAFGTWSGYFDIREQPGALRWLSDALPWVSRVVAHNFPFDYMMLREVGCHIPLDKADDTVVRACLINEHEREYSLDFLCSKYLKETKVKEVYSDLAELFGGKSTKNVQMRNISKAPSSVVAPYAAKDAELALRLWRWQEKEIDRQGIRDIVNFERSVTPSLIKMIRGGIRVDTSRAEEARKKVLDALGQAQSELDHLVGKPVNVNSSPQIRNIFVPVKHSDGQWYAGGHRLESTDSGAPSIDSDALRTMEDDPRAGLILDIRSLIKTADTFIAKHVLESSVDGWVYPSVNQTKGEGNGTSTGRLSYTAPAMQQIPSRNKEVAKVVKSLFLPDNEDHTWLDGDMASQEVRVFAHLVNNEKINAIYQKDINTDFHQAVADLTGLPRNATYSGQANAKQLNLSMIFNSGEGSIADKMGMPWKWAEFTNDKDELIRYKKPGPEAVEVIKRYHSMLPGVKQLATRAKVIAGARGYVKTKYGRRLRFPDKRFLYKASGILIQATAADINKRTIQILDPVLESHGGRIILNTHDSFSMSVPKSASAKCWADCCEVVRNEFKWMNVPLMLEKSGEGPNWWEAVK